MNSAVRRPSHLAVEIGRDLRKLYSDLMDEPVPEHLTIILRRMDQSPRAPSS